MENKGQVTIHIEGKVGAGSLTPATYDITLMQSVLECAIALLDLDKRKETPLTTLQIGEGSVNNILTTSKQKAVEFASVLALVASSASIDQLDAKTAVAFESLQDFSIQHNFKVEISSSESRGGVVQITPDTNFRRNANMYADAELYLYGKIVSCGGKTKGTIRLETDNGLYTIEADQETIEKWKENHLYKEYGIRTTAKQHVITGETVPGSFRLIEILDYSRHASDAYLQEKIRQATPHWEGVDADAFIQEIREGAYV